ncbi:DUF4825 domain-containing protein [Mesobacillus maritimus]|uniref:DUF4825 domain-containing protein n=1 Tax=Mesobacillus maritimus TaxID=1643336 RepID=UPI00384C2DB3
MRKTSRFLFFLLFILLFLNGCNLNEVNKEEDIFQFKDSYVGDAGAVGNITNLLPKPNGEQGSGLELKTTEEPYGVILNYASVEKSEGTETNYEELALYNATFILALVHNADWVTFNFVEQEFVVTREELQRFYGTDIREFNNEDDLNRFIQENLEDKNKVTQFFN